MFIGSAGFTAMSGSLFGSIVSQSSLRFAAPLALLVLHWICEAESPGFRSALCAFCFRCRLSRASGLKWLRGAALVAPGAAVAHCDTARAIPTASTAAIRSLLIDTLPWAVGRGLYSTNGARRRKDRKSVV